MMEYMKNIKSIAERILKKAAPRKHTLTLQFDNNGYKQLSKILGKIEGFTNIVDKKIQFQVSITINPDVTNSVDYEGNLTEALKMSPLTNLRFIDIRSAGAPTRIKPLRGGGV
jgi:hypothetical protein